MLDPKKHSERDVIIFGKTFDWSEGGIEHFEGLTLAQLNELEHNEHLDIRNAQNSAPDIGTFMQFMNSHKGFTAHGYVVSPHRDDYRVSVEGIEMKGDYDKKTLAAFSLLCNTADHFEIEETHLYSWWD